MRQTRTRDTELRNFAAGPMLALLVDGTAPMKTAAAHHSPTAWHDLQRDWDAWSVWEQRVITAVGCASSVVALVWFACALV